LGQKLGSHVMNSIFETSGPITAMSNDVTDSLNLQDELRDLSSKINSFTKATSDLLIESTTDSASTTVRISFVTKLLFGIVALLTFALNIGLNYVGATFGQMIIANMAISVLYVLVVMCFISDLTKGRTHFQNEREQIQERIQTVSDFLKSLLQERVQLVNSVSEVKWHLENEQIKLQMSKLEVSSHQEKIEFLGSSLNEKSKQLDDLLQETLRAECEVDQLRGQKEDLYNHLATATSVLESHRSEIGCLVDEIETLRIQEIDANAKLESDRNSIAIVSATLEDKRCDLLKIEEQLEKLTNDLFEKEETIKNLSDQILAKKDCLAVALSEIEQLNVQIAEKQQSLQANLEREVELRVSCDELEQAKQSVLVATQEAKHQLGLLQSQFDSDSERKSQLQDGIHRLQNENLELVNKTVALESHLAAQLEMMTQFESQVSLFDEATKSKELRKQQLDSEYEIAEIHVATLLKRLAELEYLAVAKTLSESASLNHQQDEMEILNENDSNLDCHNDVCPTCAEHKLDEEKRSSIEAMIEELEGLRLDAQNIIQQSQIASQEAEKQIADAEYRVEMLNKKSEGLNDQVQERISELYGLKQDLIAIRAEKRELENTLGDKEKAEETLAELRDRIEEYNLDMVQLRAQITELDESVGCKSDHVEQLENSIKELTSKLMETQGELVTYRAEVDSLASTKAELEEICESLTDVMTANLHAKNDAENDLAALRNRIAEETQDLCRLIAEQEIQLNEHERMAGSLELQREQQADMETQLGDLREREEALRVLEREVESAQRQLDALLERSLIAESDLRIRQDDLTESQNRIAEFRHEIHKYETRMTELLQAEEAVNRRISDLKIQEMETIANHDYILKDAELEQRKLEELRRELKESVARNTEANSRLQLLSDEVAEAQSIVKQWQDYIKVLEAEIKSGTARKVTLEREIELLQSNADSLHAETLAATELLSSINAKHHVAADQFNFCEQSLSRLNSELKSAESSLSVYLAQQRDAEDGIIRLAVDRDELKTEIATALLQRDQEMAKVAELQRQSHQLESLVIELQKEKEQFLSQIYALKDEAHSLGELNKESQAKLAELEQEVSSLERVAKELDKVQGLALDRKVELNQLEVELGDLRSRKKVAEEEVTELEQKQQNLRHLEKELEERSVELAKLKLEYEQQSDQLRTLLDEIASKNHLKDDLSEMENQLEQSKSALKVLEDEKSDRESKLKQVNNLISNREEELTQMQASIQDKAIQIQELAESVASHEKESLELTHRIEQSHKEIRKLASLRSNTEETIGELMHEVDRLKGVIQVCNQELKAAERSENVMKIQIESIEAQIEALLQNRLNLANETEAIQFQLASDNAQLLAIRTQVSNSEAESSTLRETILSLQEEVLRVTGQLMARKQEWESTQQIEEVATVVAETEETCQELETVSKEQSNTEDPPVQVVQEIAIEEDVWSTLNELKELEESIRLDQRDSNSERQWNPRPRESRGTARIPTPTMPRSDAWSDIFAANN
jgi:chromosome segregation ATPase